MQGEVCHLHRCCKFLLLCDFIQQFEQVIGDLLVFLYLLHVLSHSQGFRGYRILGDPGADSGGEGKCKRAEKYGTKKSKELREEPPSWALGTMPYQTTVPNGRRRSAF